MWVLIILQGLLMLDISLHRTIISDSTFRLVEFRMLLETVSGITADMAKSLIDKYPRQALSMNWYNTNHSNKTASLFD